MTISIIGLKCLSQNTRELAQKGEGFAYNLSNDLLSAWKKDKNGCLGLRCRYIDSITKNKAIIGLPQKQFLKLFGKPNSNNTNCYTYNLCSECDVNKKILRGSDRSWLVFCFSHGRLEKCTMQIQ